MRQDYVRTAWSKGLDERTVVLRHVLKNALLPVATIVGLQLPLLIGGAVVIEQIFVISGMGQLLLMAVSQRDYPVITGIFSRGRRRNDDQPVSSTSATPS